MPQVKKLITIYRALKCGLRLYFHGAMNTTPIHGGLTRFASVPQASKFNISRSSAENAKELFDQRASDLINFIVKDQVSDEARMVEKDVNALKTFERFANNAFDFLWSGEYIPIQVRQELRQQAAARGDIKGNVSDYEFKGTQSASKAGPGVR